MNNREKRFFEERFQHMEKKIQLIHDDVLVMKTQRSMGTKFVYIIAGLISLIISFLFK